jgi:hypothetical protein
MFRVLFLILVLMSSFVFAQSEDKTPAAPRLEAVKFEEFGKATNGYVKMLFDSIMVKLQANPNAQLVIINYGSDREIAKREKQIRNAIAFRRYETTRITLIRGGNEKVIRTQFWIVPEGAETPMP